MIRAFLFDLDETLVDAGAQHRRATRAMLDALGYPREALRGAFPGTVDPVDPDGAPLVARPVDTTGARTADIIEAYRARLGASQTTDEMLALRHAAFLAALDDEPAQPLPGARELVEACRARGPTAVVSSGHRDDILATLRSAHLHILFDAVVAGEDVLEAKPSPEAYQVGASRLLVQPEQCVVFEDSPRGVASARAAGCRVVAVPNARSTAPEAVKEAHVLLASLTDALPLDSLLARLEASP